MSLILGDGFDHYPTSMLLNKWDGRFPDVTGGGGVIVSSTYGRLSSQGVRIAGGSPGLTKNLAAPNSAFGFLGTAMYVPSFAVDGFIREIFSFYDPPTSGSAQIRVILENNGAISLRTGSYGGGYSAPIDTTLPGVIVAGAWFYIEAKVKIHSTSGEVHIRVNEQLVNWVGSGTTSYSGNTRRAGTNNYFTTVGLGGGDGSTVSGWGTAYFDDFYYCNDAGSINNSYLGDVQLQAIYPDGAGNSTQWAPNTGNNWAAVDETSPDDDTTYIQSSTVGHLDMFTMQNISATAAQVKGLLINNRIMKDDATARQYSSMVKDVSSGGVNTAVATRTTPYGSYTNQQDVSEVSPATSTYWTVAQVNAMEAGIKVVS